MQYMDALYILHLTFTQIQEDLNDEYFSKVLLQHFVPDITRETTCTI